MSSHIRAIQTLLKNAGFYTGEIDGIAGNLTVSAVRKALNLPEQKVSNPVQPTDVLRLSDNGLELIKQFEGFRSAPYKDIVGVWTIGYGNTYYPDGRKVSGADKALTEKEAHDLKMAIINKDFAPKVRQALEHSKVPITQNMFDACVSLAYNIGVSGFAKSSVVRQLNAGNKQAAADAFLLWNKAGGKVVKGLERRRQAERTLFLT